MEINSSRVQAVKFKEDGTPLYAWRTTDDPDPEPSTLVWSTEDNPPQGLKPYTMELSFRGTQSGLRGAWGTCYMCLEDRPLSEMAHIKGHWYCYRNGCAQEQTA